MATRAYGPRHDNLTARNFLRNMQYSSERPERIQPARWAAMVKAHARTVEYVKSDEAMAQEPYDSL